MSSSYEPFFTVVMPTFNHGHLIKKSIASVMAQTFSNWELIVVNNFSTDNTIEVINSFQDSRIKLVNFANQGVVSASRNEGIRLARGQFVACLDSDDSWYPEKLQLTYDVIQGENADVVSHHLARSYSGHLDGVLKNGPEKNTSFESLLFVGNCLTNSSVVVRKTCLDAVGGFSILQKEITAEDYEMWLKLSKARYKFKIIDRVLGEYFIHTTNLSSAIERHMNATMNVVNKYFDSLNDQGLFISLRRRLRFAKIYYGGGRQAGPQGKFKLGFSLYLMSLSLNPFRLKTYLGFFIFGLNFFKYNLAKLSQKGV